VIFFDTNILVYSSINQDTEKQLPTDQKIFLALKKNELCIYPLVLTEYLFVLAKLRQIEIQQKNINDVIHLKFAEKYCDKLITFDTDFEKLKSYTNLEIEILG